jgi:hypothetical protein
MEGFYRSNARGCAGTKDGLFQGNYLDTSSTAAPPERPPHAQGCSELFQSGVEGGVEFAHGGFGFVAHVGDAEGGPF